MITSKMPATRAAFNRFLYASVGDDTNGMDLTLLSALARQNVDPWEKAADWSQLPGGAAMETLETFLESVPGHESSVERTALAGRLVSLLPRPAKIQGGGANASHPESPPELPVTTTDLTWVVIYFVALVVCGWWFSDHTPPQVVARPIAASAPVATERASAKSPGD